MDDETLHNLIRTRFKDEVVGTTKLVVAYDNAPFVEPEGKMWVRLNIQHSITNQTEIGATKRFRTYGLIIVQIFIPIEEGDVDALILAKTIRDTYRCTTISGVTYQTPYKDIVGRSGKWYQINVVCPFHADDTQ